MSSDVFIYSIERGQQLDALFLTELATSAALGGEYATLTPVFVDGTTYLFGYMSDRQSFDVYRFSVSPPWLTMVPAQPKLGMGRDAIEFFTIGNLPHVVVYARETGHFEFYAIARDLSISKPYVHFNNASTGYTTVKAFTHLGQVGLLAYNSNTGAVAIYSVTVTATSSEEAPPLQQRAIWTHLWAKGWVRFAMYQFGGENFFLKTNTARPNVNIDHILDDPRNGTVEVASYLDLTDALELDIVEPFTLTNGEAYFVTYRKDNGRLTFNRFHSDCMGWTTVMSLTSKRDACHAIFVNAGGKLHLVIV